MSASAQTITPETVVMPASVEKLALVTLPLQKVVRDARATIVDVSKTTGGLIITLANNDGAQRVEIALSGRLTDPETLREAALGVVTKRKVETAAKRDVQRLSDKPKPVDPAQLRFVQEAYLALIHEAGLIISGFEQKEGKKIEYGVRGPALLIADPQGRASKWVKLHGGEGEVVFVEEAIALVKSKVRGATPEPVQLIPEIFLELAEAAGVQFKGSPERVKGDVCRVAIQGIERPYITTEITYDAKNITESTRGKFSRLASQLASDSKRPADEAQAKPQTRLTIDDIDPKFRALAIALGVAMTDLVRDGKITQHILVTLRPEPITVDIDGTSEVVDLSLIGRPFEFSGNDWDNERFETAAMTVVANAKRDLRTSLELEKANPNYGDKKANATADKDTDPVAREARRIRRLDAIIKALTPESEVSVVSAQSERVIAATGFPALNDSYYQKANEIGVTIKDPVFRADGSIERVSLSEASIVVTAGRGREQTTLEFFGGSRTVNFIFNPDQDLNDPEQLERFDAKATAFRRHVVQARQQIANWAIEHRQRFPSTIAITMPEVPSGRKLEASVKAPAHL